MTTRYLIEIDGGGDLQVIAQNTETDSTAAQATRGQRVDAAWPTSAMRLLDVDNRESGA